MNIAVIGCGHVADQYAKTLANYPQLRLVGAYDRNQQYLDAFCGRWRAAKYTSLEHALDDTSVEMVLNLTNPRSHAEVTKSCIHAGRHVYSEKPLAMNAEAARELVELAKNANVFVASAPCSLLGETAQTIWKAIEKGVVGRIRLVYANFDDGMIAPKQTPWAWQNDLGIPWPAKDEFEVGCTYEHAGYLLTWLAAFFGPAKFVTAFASCQIPDKGIPVDMITPDFSVGCIEYANGIVARVTCGLVAPRDKSLTVIGDDGVIFTGNVRHDASPVYIRADSDAGIERRLNSWRTWLESCLKTIPWSGHEWRLKRKYPFATESPVRFVSHDKPVDFCRGPAELADAIVQKRPCRLSAELALHVTEIVEALQYPEKFNGRRKMESSFASIQPLDWRN